MLTSAFYQIKERNLRDLISDIYSLIKKIIISIYNFFVWAYNKILGTELSINWKIFWWCIGIIFVLGLILTAYLKVRKLRRRKKTPTTEPKQRADSSKDMDRPATLACWKCQKSVPVAEYSTHVDQCVLQKPQFRV
jgi:H+/Cl- antiporter ClcA